MLLAVGQQVFTGSLILRSSCPTCFLESCSLPGSRVGRGVLLAYQASRSTKCRPYGKTKPPRNNSPACPNIKTPLASLTARLNSARGVEHDPANVPQPNTSCCREHHVARKVELHSMPTHSWEQARQLPPLLRGRHSGAKCSTAFCIFDQWVWMLFICWMSEAAFCKRCAANSAWCFASKTKCPEGVAYSHYVQLTSWSVGQVVGATVSSNSRSLQCSLTLP